jgi:subtilase family serine protease
MRWSSGFASISLLLSASVSVFSLSGQEIPPAVNNQPSQSPSHQSPTAHTNFEIESLGMQTQEMKLETPLEQITVGNKAVSGIQILDLPSDQATSSSDIMARFAIATGVPLPKGAKLVAHTDFKVAGRGAAPSPTPIAAIGSVVTNTPAELISRYGLRGATGIGLIVIVDAYAYPTAEDDLSRFSTQYGLPPCSVTNGCLTILKVDPSNTLPDNDPRVAPDSCGWSIESAIDLQWAHAIAPMAKLILVEASSRQADDLFAGVDLASKQAESAGGGIVSLSWSFDEVADETKYDLSFQHQNVLYFAASGDQGGVVQFPAASPFVIAVGGSQVTRGTDHKVISEVVWPFTGGGFSIPEMRPPFQNPPLENIDGTTGRVTPDISGPAGIDRQLDNGSPLYVGTLCSPNVPGWYAAGGTSLATPILAAAASLSFPHGANTAVLLQNIYSQRVNTSAVKDITFGRAGNNFAKPGFDPATGVGVPSSLKFDLPRSTP